jgi:hypothetical protein
MRISLLPALFLIAIISISSFGKAAAQQSAAPKNDRIDPLALDILRATMDSIHNAKTFSFQAMVAKEQLGSNDQIVTMFRRSDVTVSRPNRMRMHVLAEGQNIDLYYNSGQATLFAPDKKLFTSMTAGDTLDKVVDALEAREIEVPLSPLLRSDPYKTMTDGLEGAAAVGRMMIEGRTFHHLVFTEKNAEWQIWVEAGAKPTPRRVQIVYTSMPRQPRVTIDFSNWNLDATPAADFFTFHKPADAKAISQLSAAPGEKK